MALNTARASASLLSSSILLLLVASASSTSFGNVLKAGDKLSAGGILSMGSYKFTMQRDCNLVLYDNDVAIWASNTPGMGISCSLLLQTSGELFIISGSGSLVWRSETGGGAYGKYALVLQPNGNVVVYGNPVWSTGRFTPLRTSNVPPSGTANSPPRKHISNNP